MIILIGGEKGGTGKTTIATNLSVHFKQSGRDVLLIDTDKQGSASFLSSTRDALIQSYIEHPGHLKNLVSDNLREVLRISNIQKFGDSIIIDAGGRFYTM